MARGIARRRSPTQRSPARHLVRTGLAEAPCPSRSEVLRPALHGVVPDLVAVLVEHQLGVLRRREPEPVGELALELARRPAGVAECDQALARAAMVADVAQDLAARRHRDAAVDVDGVGAMVFGAVDHKADIGLYRTAGEDAHLSRNRRVLLAERFQKLR